MCQTKTCIKIKTTSMCPLLLLSLVLLLVLSTTSCLARHIISINSSTLQFSSLVWDSTAQHFVVGSAMNPTVYAISNEGMVKCLLSESFTNSSGVSVTALAIDQIRLQLIVAFSNPSYVYTYDLKSYRRIYAVPLPELDGAPSGIVVDLESGEVFVSSAKRGVVLKVAPQGVSKKGISEFKISSDKGLGGIVYLRHGYILVLQTTTRKIFKVDTTDRTMKEVLLRDSSKPLTQSDHAIALQTEKSIAIATNQSLLLIKSDDNSWTRGTTIHNKMKMDKGEMVVAVAMREGKNVYVLVNSQKGYIIEEAVYVHVRLVVLILVGSVCICCILWLMWQQLNDKTIPANTPYGHVFLEPVNLREMYLRFQKR